MTVLFPSLVPTARQYMPPKWPTTSLFSQSGLASHRVWANAPSQGTLQLSFTNISEVNGLLITDAYDAARGTLIDVSLPLSVFHGAEALYDDIINKFDKYGLKWYFSSTDAPSPNSVVPGICSINVNLVAELRLS